MANCGGPGGEEDSGCHGYGEDGQPQLVGSTQPDGVGYVLLDEDRVDTSWKKMETFFISSAFRTSVQSASRVMTEQNVYKNIKTQMSNKTTVA